MRALLVPDALIRSVPVYVPPRLNRTWSPGCRAACDTRSTVRQGLDWLPDAESEPVVDT
jgi:hypothetical protein